MKAQLTLMTMKHIFGRIGAVPRRMRVSEHGMSHGLNRGTGIHRHELLQKPEIRKLILKDVLELLPVLGPKAYPK